MQAIVKYGNGYACFAISKEIAGVYVANLIYCDGDSKNLLPNKITLIKGIRQWAGSIENSTLLDELGKSIEGAHSKELTLKSN